MGSDSGEADVSDDDRDDESGSDCFRSSSLLGGSESARDDGEKVEEIIMALAHLEGSRLENRIVMLSTKSTSEIRRNHRGRKAKLTEFFAIRPFASSRMHSARSWHHRRSETRITISRFCAGPCGATSLEISSMASKTIITVAATPRAAPPPPAQDIR